jgi:hypothetical protein
MYMLLIPKAFSKYVSRRPFPVVVEINYIAGCRWHVHAHPFNTDTNVHSRRRHYQNDKDNPTPPNVLDDGWYGLTDFLGLKLGDYVMFKVIPKGFKMTMYDRITSCEREVSCNDHP